MKYLVLLFLLTGCATTTVPVTSKFPEVPNLLMQACPDLLKLKEGAKLSDVSKTVTINYTTYYDCAVKIDGWIEWYSKQKIIFEEMK